MDKAASRIRLPIEHELSSIDHELPTNHLLIRDIISG